MFSFISFIMNVFTAVRSYQWYKNNKVRVNGWIDKVKGAIAYFRK